MVMVCFVLLRETPEFDSERFRKSFTDRWPGNPIIDIEASESVTTTIEFADDECVIVGAMPAKAITENSDTWTPLWVDANSEIPLHQSHLVVTAVAKNRNDVDKAMMVTRVVDAILRSNPSSMGVLWGRHAHPVSKKSFNEICETLEEGAVPHTLWISYRVTPGVNSTSDNLVDSSGMTRGMDAFGLREIVCMLSPETPDEMFLRISSLAEYLLENGPVINDGDTVGETASEKIRVRYSGDDAMHLIYPKREPEPEEPGGLKSIITLIVILAITAALIAGLVFAVSKLGKMLVG